MFFEVGSPTTVVYAYYAGESLCFNVIVIHWLLPDTYLSSNLQKKPRFSSLKKKWEIKLNGELLKDTAGLRVPQRGMKD